MALLRCDRGHEIDDSALHRLCPECGAPLSHVFEGSLKRETSDQSMWRYRSHLPVDPACIVSLGEGGTPLLRTRLPLGSNVYWKNETRNPTGSQKDRALSVAISAAVQRGARRLIMASTGSAGFACAAYAARAGLPCYILCPAETPVERLIGMWMLGAQILPVRGSFEDLMKIIATARDRWGYCETTTYRRANPYQAEGPKTIAYEIFDQLGGRAPDAVIVPVGGGGTLSGIGKGFAELLAIGFISKIPRLVAVQNVQFNALALALERDLHTEADIEALGLDAHVQVLTRNLKHAVPPDAEDALAAIRASGGSVVQVTDQEALEAQRELARADGIFAEPSSSVGLVAARKLTASGQLKSSETAVAVITGSALREMGVVTETHHPEIKSYQVQDALSALQR